MGVLRWDVFTKLDDYRTETGHNGEKANAQAQRHEDKIISWISYSLPKYRE